MDKFHELQEQKLKLDKWEINYMIIGKGSHVVLLMPGTLGSIMLNFEPQVLGLNREAFTIVAWDPPGQGKSYPPERWFSEAFYEEYADFAYRLMTALRFSQYTLLGWCGGGRAGMILAARHPHLIRALVTWNTSTFLKSSNIETLQKHRDPLQWPKRAKQPLLEVYSETYLHNFWETFVSGLEAIYNKKKGDICTPYLQQIQCPTLLIHAENDCYIDVSHVYFMHQRIRSSQVYIFSEGKHDCHKTHSDKFNAIVEEYLKNVDKGESGRKLVIENVK